MLTMDIVLFGRPCGCVMSKDVRLHVSQKKRTSLEKNLDRLGQCAYKPASPVGSGNIPGAVENRIEEREQAEVRA